MVLSYRSILISRHKDCWRPDANLTLSRPLRLQVSSLNSGGPAGIPIAGVDLVKVRAACDLERSTNSARLSASATIHDCIEFGVPFLGARTCCCDSAHLVS